ncbi:unnamed protein product [Euphydryas editha]|uniref:Uncharacterized protein n=1 Tax=Euphydryas editha TaxID=104508 RepID=A0AAU9USF6_EUPED|nr:unnamed protein product [Euphydryas editha]
MYSLVIAYAITIYKSQGLSLNNVLMDIGSAVFTSGQAYVGFLRVASLGGLYLINVDFGSIKARNPQFVKTKKHLPSRLVKNCNIKASVKKS